MGLLAFCLEHARDSKATVGGVFAAIRKSFTDLAAANFAADLNSVKDFRNKYIAHAEEGLTDRELARGQMGIWLSVLAGMHGGDEGQ